MLTYEFFKVQGINKNGIMCDSLKTIACLNRNKEKLREVWTKINTDVVIRVDNVKIGLGFVTRFTFGIFL